MKIRQRILSFLLVIAVAAGCVGQIRHPMTAQAKTAVLSLKNMGTHGEIIIHGHKKSSNSSWWQQKLDGKQGFCLTLGGRCYTGDTYKSTKTVEYSSGDSGKAGAYARVIYWYDTVHNQGKRAWIFAQALMWSIAAGDYDEKSLKQVLKTMKENTGYFDKSANELYKAIFETKDTFVAKATHWEKQAGWQELMTVDSEPVKAKYEYSSTSKEQFYRQRITVHKKDENGKPLEGVKFTLHIDNYEEIYSYAVKDRDDNYTQNKIDESHGLDVTGYTDANGQIAFRLTYRLQSEEIYYYEDEVRNQAGFDYAEAEKILKDEDLLVAARLSKDMADYSASASLVVQFQNIRNDYVLTEEDPGNANIHLGSDNVTNITLKKDQSWVKGTGDTWPDTDAEDPAAYEKAYQTDDIVNEYKRVAVQVKKQAGNTADGKAYGDAVLQGARYMLYSDAACQNEATVYVDDQGTTGPCPGYVTDEKGEFVTDYLVAGQTYYLKELEAPRGFLLNDKVEEIVPSAGKETEQKYVREADRYQTKDDEIVGNVEIYKFYPEHDDEDSALLPEKNVTFQVYLKSRNSYEAANPDYERDTIKTDDEGHAVTKDLVYGTYVVHQVDTGDQDTIPVKDFTVEIQKNKESYPFHLINEYFKAFVKIVKKDKQSGKTVLKAGTAYQIYKVENGQEKLVSQSYKSGDQKVSIDRFITDETGEIMTVKPLRSGIYRVYEVESASGLHIGTRYIEIEINSKNKNYKTVQQEDGTSCQVVEGTYYNEETKGKLIIAKRGEQLTDYSAEKKEFVYEQKPLKGAVFEICAEEDIATQDGQGDFWFKKGERAATVTTGVGVKFEKEIEGLTGASVDGQGDVTVELPLGKYVVREIGTAYGYIFPETTEWKVQFDWKNSQDVFVLNSTGDTDSEGVLRVENARAKASVELTKQDGRDGAGISGAVFGLYSRNDIYNCDGKKIVEAGSLLDTITTDQDGKAVSVTDVPLMSEGYGTTEGARNSGDYYLREISVSDSYYKDEAEIPVHLEYKDAKTSRISAEAVKKNTQTAVEIDKLSIAGSEEIPGCHLQIADAEGHVIVSWISGDDTSVKTYDKLDESGYRNFHTSMERRGICL